MYTNMYMIWYIYILHTQSVTVCTCSNHMHPSKDRKLDPNQNSLTTIYTSRLGRVISMCFLQNSSKHLLVSISIHLAPISSKIKYHIHSGNQTWQWTFY